MAAREVLAHPPERRQPGASAGAVGALADGRRAAGRARGDGLHREAQGGAAAAQNPKTPFNNYNTRVFQYLAILYNYKYFIYIVNKNAWNMALQEVKVKPYPIKCRYYYFTNLKLIILLKLIY